MSKATIDSEVGLRISKANTSHLDPDGTVSETRKENRESEQSGIESGTTQSENRGKVAHGASAAAVLAGRPDVAMALGAAGEGMGEASKIIGHTHNATKPDLERPAKKAISTTGVP